MMYISNKHMKQGSIHKPGIIGIKPNQGDVNPIKLPTHQGSAIITICMLCSSI